MLRLWRDFFRQVPGYFGSDGPDQDRFGSPHRGGYDCLGRFKLPDAIAGRARSRGIENPDHAPGGSARVKVRRLTGIVGCSLDPLTNIQSTLADQKLQTAIYAGTGRLAEGRRKSLLPDWQELRQHAHDIKKHTLENLDHYLELLERNIEARGGNVIW